MRAIALLLLPLAAVLAGDSLLAREGSGWEGFGKGSSVRLKTTYIREGGVPVVTISVLTLAEVAEETLTLQIDTRNALTTQEQRTTVLPRHGEAGPGERAAVETLSAEPVFVGEKRFDCARRKTTVTGPQGRRVITDWICTDPEARLKRTVVAYDDKGVAQEEQVMLLTSFDERHRIGEREVRCLAYSTVHTFAGQEQRGRALVSRDVPGDTVRMDAEIFKDGQRIFTIRVEALEFTTK